MSNNYFTKPIKQELYRQSSDSSIKFLIATISYDDAFDSGFYCVELDNESCTIQDMKEIVKAMEQLEKNNTLK